MSRITNIRPWPRLEPRHKINTEGWVTYEVCVDGNNSSGYLVACHPAQDHNWTRDIVDTGLVEGQGPNKPPTSVYVFTVSVEATSEDVARDKLAEGIEPDDADNAELETVL